MAKQPPMELIWKKLSQENPKLSDDLDRMYMKTDDGSCYQYLRQRGKDKGTTKNPRKSVLYDGVRRQMGIHRLVQAREHGRIDAGMHVGHPQPKEHGGCGHPEHLKSYVPATRQVKPEEPTRSPDAGCSSVRKRVA